jgi:hypothetical protein
VAHGADAGLQSPCSPESLNHSVLRRVVATCLPHVSSAFNGACCTPCERAEQPLLCSVLEDTRVLAPMEIMMAWSPGGIYLFALRLAESVLRTRSSSGAAMSQMVGAGGQVSHGGPRAVPGQEAGAETTGARPSQEAGARATETRDSPEATPS